MSDLFIKIFNLSVTAGWLVLAVLLCRPLMKKAPKWINCLLWGIVGLRLVFPFSLESIFSLVPSAEPIPEDIMFSPTPEINSGIGAVNSVINPIISTNLTPEIGTSVNPMQLVVAIASVVWVIGIALMLGYEIVSYISLRFKVRASVRGEKNVYFCDEVDSPFILGVIRPRIYVPSGMSGEALEHVLAHERAHLRRGDHFWKPIGFAILAFYWFNPLLWVAYVLLCRDIEAACDEKVIKKMPNEAKKSYSEALLACSLHRKRIMACPLAFGEVGVKQRIKSVLNYKKPAFWVIIVALVATIIVSVCFLTNPQSNVRELLEPGSKWRYEGDLTLSVTVENTGSMEGLIIDDDQFDEIVIRYRNDGGKVRAYILEAKIEDIKYESNGDLVSNIEYNEWRDRVEAEHLLLSGILTARGDDVVLKIDQDNLGIGSKRLVLERADDSSSKYPWVIQDANGNYIRITDSGSDIKGLDASFIWAKCEDNNVVFWLKWKNKSLKDRSIGESFKIYRYDGENELVALEGFGYWHEMAIRVSKSVTYMDYNITEHYDISALGKYRFERDGAWVEFEVIAPLGSEFPHDIASLGNGLFAAITDYGCDAQGVEVDFRAIQYRSGIGRSFLINWKNSTGKAHVIGPEFTVYFHDGKKYIPLDNISAWETDRIAVEANSELKHSHMITDHYDISEAGKYRFECGGAWVDFEVKSLHDIYTGLDAMNGLDVYVWQMAQGSYSFAVMPHSDESGSSILLFDMPGVNAAGMRAILSTYDISEDKIYIIPWQNPISSYIGDFWVNWQYIDDNAPQENFYYAIVYDMLFGASPRRYYPTATETEWFDIDGDGTKEENRIFFGLVDGKFMFRYIIEDNKTVYCNDIFYTAPMSLKFFTSEEKLRLRGVTEDGGIHIYDIVPENGHVKLVEIESAPIADPSNKTLDLSKADISLVNRIVVTNGKTGEVAYLNTAFNRTAFNDFMNALKTVKASDPVSNKGHSGFNYHVELYYDFQTVFTFSLCNEPTDAPRIVCGYYETDGGVDYAARYQLTGEAYAKLDEVIKNNVK